MIYSMKTKTFLIRILITLLLVVSPKIFFAQNDSLENHDTIICLHVRGLAVQKNAAIDGAEVKLYKDSGWVESVEITSVVKHLHSFDFDLLGNSYYTIEISKEGYIARLIVFSTILPKDVEIDGRKFIFDFDMNLFMKKNGNENFYDDFPAAIIRYDEKKKLFIASAKYAQDIKARLAESAVQTTVSAPIR